MLVIHPGTLGDVLLSVPALRVLGETHPNLKVFIVCRGQIGNLLRRYGEVDEVIEMEGRFPGCLLAGGGDLEPSERDFLGQCDVVVSWMKDPDGILCSFLAEVGVSKVIVRSPHAPELEGLHQSDRFLRSIGEKEMCTGAPWAMELPDSLIQEGTLLLEGYKPSRNHSVVCIHPGSGSRHKCCPPTLFAELIAWLRAQQAIPVLLCGPADREMIQDVLRHCPIAPAVVQDRDLLSLAGMLVPANLYLGHDSGLTHLSAALSIPTIAMFGPTDPRRWAPRGANVHILTGEPCRCDDWTTVQTCHAKPCLNISLQALIERSRNFI